jgi:hypothetical protein
MKHDAAVANICRRARSEREICISEAADAQNSAFAFCHIN